MMRARRFTWGIAALCVLLLPVVWLPVARGQGRGTWRTATTAELEAFLPARATVEKERIETELRTATGIIDERRRMIAAVVLITAGYSADGKYSHYLLTQAEMRLGTELRLPPGAYVLGWSRVESGLLVHVFDARTGVEQGQVLAWPIAQPTRVESFRIWAPAEHKGIQIGRFAMPYRLEE